MSAIRINGIRVGHQMFHLCQRWTSKDSETPPVYRTLAEQGINLPCLGLVRNESGQVSCCLEQRWGDWDTCPACIVSVYPHGYKIAILGRLLSLFAHEGILFFHMASSTAMISFVVAQTDKERALAALEKTFNLPSTHTPYEPGFQEETRAFVKQRYKETRAYFREEKIKTYGLDLETDLNLTGIFCDNLGLEKAGQALWHQESEKNFYFATAVARPQENKVSLYWVTRDRGDENLFKENLPDMTRDTVDVIRFHGPHFGDRFGIFNAAAACLDRAGLGLRLAGCTGASITLVLPSGCGEQGVLALEEGFETP